MKRILVQAMSNPVPCEGAPRRFIDGAPVEVSLTPYYQRRLSEGELRQVDAPPAPPAPRAPEEKK